MKTWDKEGLARIILHKTLLSFCNNSILQGECRLITLWFAQKFSHVLVSDWLMYNCLDIPYIPLDNNCPSPVVPHLTYALGSFKTMERNLTGPSASSFSTLRCNSSNPDFNLFKVKKYFLTDPFVLSISPVFLFCTCNYLVEWKYSSGKRLRQSTNSSFSFLCIRTIQSSVRS